MFGASSNGEEPAPRSSERNSEYFRRSRVSRSSGPREVALVTEKSPNSPTSVAPPRDANHLHAETILLDNQSEGDLDSMEPREV